MKSSQANWVQKRDYGIITNAQVVKLVYTLL